MNRKLLILGATALAATLALAGCKWGQNSTEDTNGSNAQTTPVATQPAAQPTAPAAQPTTPAAQPTAPAAQPASDQNNAA